MSATDADRKSSAIVLTYSELCSAHMFNRISEVQVQRHAPDVHRRHRVRIVVTTTTIITITVTMVTHMHDDDGVDGSSSSF